jgi:hypothetical protein
MSSQIEKMKVTDSPPANNSACRLFVLQNCFASLADDFAEINFQNISDPQQGIEGGIPRIRFQTANQRLAQTRFFCQNIAGNALPFSLLNEQPHNFGADFISMAIF